MNTSIWPQVFEYRIIRSPLHLCTIPGELQLSVGREILTDWNCLINIELATLWKTNRHKIQRMHSQSKSSQYHVVDSNEISRRGPGCLWIMRAPSNARQSSWGQQASRWQGANKRGQRGNHQITVSCCQRASIIAHYICGILSDGYCSVHLDFFNHCK